MNPKDMENVMQRLFGVGPLKRRGFVSGNNLRAVNMNLSKMAAAIRGMVFVELAIGGNQ
jgi:hypothetical protein